MRKLFDALFRYPPLDLREVDYDRYWRVKTGGALGVPNAYQRLRAAWIADRLEPHASVLDIGCGDGAVLIAIRQRKPIDACGVDTSTYALDFVASRGIRTIRRTLDRPECLDDLPVADHILLLEVLEHLPAPERFLQRALEKSRKSVFFSFPNTGYLLHRLRLVLGRFPLQWEAHPGEHLRFWTYRDLRWWLGELGYLGHTAIHVYKGVPILNRVWKGLFGGAFLCELVHDRRR
jgi:methionine biosynthesis protein MetW